MGKLGMRQVVAVESVDQIVVGAGQRVLRGDQFNVVGDSRREAFARLSQFFVGEGQTGTRDVT